MNDAEAINGKFPISESVRRCNPHLFAVGAVVSPERKRDPGPALARGASSQKGGAKGVAILVTIVAFRKRLLDDDNLVAGFKPLRDAIAREIGIDDGDKRIRFECQQVRTSGKPGCAVRVELI